MLYKDAANRKSNQQNLGTIRCSNLCTEIIEYTAPDEVTLNQFTLHPTPYTRHPTPGTLHPTPDHIV